ncbi:unnamed protein product [Allacma fusca]|uniref:Protein tincar n=1 Tax=Allacma fusca TaxID=39272 RepID=A0A8J2KW53_9HEXA|nr:unnamed protein product [Allacma fusca]
MASKEETRSGKHRARFNSITSIWYGLIVGAFQAYLIVRSVRRFVCFTELPWPFQKTPFMELNTYIALTGVAVLLLPFFLAACILQVGNSSNDSRMLGRHLGSKDEWSLYLVPSMLYQGTRSFFRTIWTHSGPTSSVVHVISSFCLLLPQTLMEAVLIKFGFITQDAVWKTDLDVLMYQRERNEVLGILSKGSGDTTSPSPTVVGPDSLMYLSPEVMRPEFINYAVALIVFSVRYANVFWHGNKTFTVLFSVQLIVNSIHSLVSFSCFSVLYKLHVFGPTRILFKDLPLLLNHHVTLLLYIISVTILLFSSGILYHYGYLKIASFVKHKARAQYVTNGEDPSGYGVGWAYFPHCSALAVLLALASTQSPLVHDATLVYRASLDNCMLADIVSSAAHMLLWMALWLNLTTRRNWTFHVDVNIGRIRVKGLESLRLAADIALDLPDSPATPHTPMSSAMLVVSDSQAFAVTDVNSKKSILGVLLRNAQLKREGESDERIYWPRRSPVAGTQNSLEDDEQPWLHEKDTTASPCRNKVTFHDDLPSPRKYASVPLPRMGGLKRNFRDRSFNQLSQGEIDEGDYALLRGGKNGMTKHQVTSDADYEEHQELLALVTTSGEQHTQVMPGQSCNGPLHGSIPETTAVAQGTPRSLQSTDSGYNGRSGSVTRSESRSTASSASPPDRTVSDSSSGVHSTYSTNNAGGNPTPQSQSKNDTNCHCEGEQCYVEHTIYGRISRRNSIKLKSPTHPIYETSTAHGKNQCSIYESRLVPVPVVVPPPSVPENPYGDNLNSKKFVNLTVSATAAGRENESLSPYSINQWKSCSLNRVQCLTPDPVNGCTDMAKQSNGMESMDESRGKMGDKLEKQEPVTIRRKPSLTRPKTTDMSPVIQSTPYGRCTNMKMTSFADQPTPPIPPPLPPLSFVTSSVTSSHHGTIPTSANTSRGLISSGSFRESPRLINHTSVNYVSPQYPRHSTIPNHSGASNGDVLSTFHTGNGNAMAVQPIINTYPMVQSSHYNHLPAPILQHKN